MLCWFLSHVGISGNEKANTAAKCVLSLRVTPMKIPAADLVPCVTKLISEKWQQFWKSCTGNKLLMKIALRETQTLCAGCSKAEPKIFAPPQTPSRGHRTAKI